LKFAAVSGDSAEVDNVAVDLEPRSEDSPVKATDVGSRKIRFSIQQSFGIDREPHYPHRRTSILLARIVLVNTDERQLKLQTVHPYSVQTSQNLFPE
jgi:hypothetical protein